MKSQLKTIAVFLLIPNFGFFLTCYFPNIAPYYWYSLVVFMGFLLLACLYSACFVWKPDWKEMRNLVIPADEEGR